MDNILSFCNIAGNSVKAYKGLKKYIATGDVINNKVVSYENVDFYNKPSRANQIVKTGDVLFAKMQNTIKVLKIDEKNQDNIYSTGFYVIEPKENLVTSDFLYWLFNSKAFNIQKDKNCKGATQKAINNEGLMKITIHKLPAVEEQKVIVKKIENIYRNILLKEKQIEELNKLIKSQFVESTKFSQNRLEVS